MGKRHRRDHVEAAACAVRVGEQPGEPAGEFRAEREPRVEFQSARQAVERRPVIGERECRIERRRRGAACVAPVAGRAPRVPRRERRRADRAAQARFVPVRGIASGADHCM
ncbi:hypothetical protein WK08_27465 [Burkholderia ubonensis]|nr:hypothetical protein WK08_27465 [Burkholderia ubonensis]